MLPPSCEKFGVVMKVAGNVIFSGKSEAARHLARALMSSTDLVN